jgi:hypothetical protein
LLYSPRQCMLTSAATQNKNVHRAVPLGLGLRAF